MDIFDIQFKNSKNLVFYYKASTFYHLYIGNHSYIHLDL